MRSRLILSLAAIIAIASIARANEPPGHDPCVIKEGNTYYLFGTGRGITLSISTDLINWQKQPDVFENQPDWAKSEVPGTKDFWAPDISYHDGRYQLYYSISTFGSDRSCIGLATNETLDRSSPKYKWVDHGVVIQTKHGENWNAIDENFVADENGSAWLVLGSYWSGIKLIELDPNTGMLKPGAELHSLAERPKEKAIEAAFIVRHGGFYYLFVSFDGCCQGAKSTYNVRVGRSEKITGPYVDADGRAMLQGGGTVVIKSLGRVRGPGHEAVFSDGGKDYLVHHFYDADEKGKAKVQIRPITWSEAGWPTAGEAINKPAKPATRPVAGIAN